MKLFLDIETIPAEKEKHEVLKKIHARKLKDGRKVTVKFDEYLLSTSLDGAFGRMICIGYAVNDDPVQLLRGEEKDMLQKFWDVAKRANVFIGFNNMDFDLRFIYQRSTINKVKPTRLLSFARYRSDPIFDIMWEWRKWGREPSISLDTLARALGLESSKDGGIEGKDVWKAYQDGRVVDICEYCKRDVELTRLIYKRMTFED